MITMHDYIFYMMSMHHDIIKNEFLFIPDKSFNIATTWLINNEVNVMCNNGDIFKIACPTFPKNTIK